MTPEMDELVSSFFDNGYVTQLDAEIRDYICQTEKGTKKAFIDVLCQRGYKIDDITQEFDRQCSCSTLRYVPSDDTYVGVPLGMNLWSDMCNRIHDQESMVAGRLQRTGSSIKIDIYRTDFQSLKLKKKVKSIGLRPCPVMRWTKKFQKGAALKCLDYLMEVLPPAPHEGGSSVLQEIREVISRKPKRAPWAWLVAHPVVKLELSPTRKRVVKTLLSLSNGPVDWKGTPVSLDELKMHTNLPSEEIEESIEYFNGKGIVRKVYGDFTPTSLGYPLLRHAFRSRPCVTFAVVYRTDREYQLEVSTPSYLAPEIRDSLEERGGTISGVSTPAVFFFEKSQVGEVMDALITELLNPMRK
ncbi:MAG: hypothetical protein HXS48_13745 [Theionarchaea archaeon]|nr:hypothetical protein [Theionarchaea archaeon]